MKLWYYKLLYICVFFNFFIVNFLNICLQIFKNFEDSIGEVVKYVKIIFINVSIVDVLKY